MPIVGAILRYSHVEPTFENNSRGQLPCARPTSGLSAEDHTLFIVLPNHHIWAPHTIQRAVFSTSSRSRASTTVIVDHCCPNGCCEHPSYADGIHVPLLRKIGGSSCTDKSRRRSWRHFIDRSSQSLPRPLSRMIQRAPQEQPDTKPARTSWVDQAIESTAR